MGTTMRNKLEDQRTHRMLAEAQILNALKPKESNQLETEDQFVTDKNVTVYFSRPKKMFVANIGGVEEPYNEERHGKRKEKEATEGTEYKTFLAEGRRQGRSDADLLKEWNERMLRRGTTINLTPTSEGLVPFISRGAGVGTVGTPTGLGKPIPEGSVKEIGGLETVLENINKIKRLYGYDTPKEHKDWVGPVSGRYGSIQERFLGSATPDQSKFYAYVRDNQDALLRARSGAQINEQEYNRLVNFLPDPNLPAPTFKARLERFEDETRIILSKKRSALAEGGYGNLKNKPAVVMTEKEARKKLKDMGYDEDKITGYINLYRQEGVIK